MRKTLTSRFQFSLKTLFVAVTILSIALGYFTWQRQIVRERKIWRNRLLPYGAYVGVVRDLQTDDLPMIRKMMGDYPVYYVEVPPRFEANVPEIQNCFPESHVLVRRTYDNEFDDKHKK